MLDIAIVGAGPAGLSAAITGRIRQKQIKVFGNPPFTSYIARAEKIDNYLGMMGVSGHEMMERFLEHTKEIGVNIQTKKVINIFPMPDYYLLQLENEWIEARTIILANGLTKTAVLEGENDFVGRGVSYCATCDGPFFKEKKVAVIGDSSQAEEEANYLSEICERVYYIPLYRTVDHLADKIEIIHKKPKRIYGKALVSGIDFTEGSLEVHGVFIIKENIPTAQLLSDLEMKNKSIKVNRMMETNLPGVFAAGDCTGRPFQVAKAVGEGNTAVLQAVKYLSEKYR